MLDEAIAHHAGDPDAWSRDLLTRLQVLGRVFAKHVRETQAIDGSLQEIMLLRPNLMHAVKIIKEHQSIEMQRAILERVVGERLAQSDKDIEFFRESTGKLLETLRLHQAKGVDLLYEAFYRDEGGTG